MSKELIQLLRTENAELKEDNQSLREELARLRQAIQALNNLQTSLEQITPETDTFALIRAILSAALNAVNSNDGSLQLLDEETGELIFVEVHGEKRQQLLGYHLPPGIGIAGWVAKHRVPQLVRDVRLEPRFSPLVDRKIGFHTVSLICVPLIDGQRTIGTLEVVNPRGDRPFQESDLDTLMLVARLASIAIQQAEGRWR